MSSLQRNFFLCVQSHVILFRNVIILNYKGPYFTAYITYNWDQRDHDLLLYYTSDPNVTQAWELRVWNMKVTSSNQSLKWPLSETSKKWHLFAVDDKSESEADWHRKRRKRMSAMMTMKLLSWLPKSLFGCCCGGQWTRNSFRTMYGTHSKIYGTIEESLKRNEKCIEKLYCKVILSGHQLGDSAHGGEKPRDVEGNHI